MGMRKIHYGWVICVTCTLLLFVTMGTVSNGFSIYLPYIMAERGLTHAQTSSLVTLRCLVADRLGGYIPAYLLFSAIIALTLLCIALAYRSGGRDR